MQFTINRRSSYKIGMHEIDGLAECMTRLMQPVLRALNAQESWSGDDWFKLDEVEYRSRDGFIPYSHNCGGIEVRSVIPKCGESDFSWLEFGEHDSDCAYHNGDECTCGENDGYLDASLRIWFKFEGIDGDGVMDFYLVVAGGNGDAPYFRRKYESTYFDASFQARNFDELARVASKPVSDVIRMIKQG